MDSHFNLSSNNNEGNKELPQKALARIAAICNGNGIKPSDVGLISAQGKTLSCAALTHVSLTPSVSHETKKGRHQIGIPVQNFDFIDQEINKTLQKALQNNETRKYLADMLLKRPDKGFGLHGETISLDNFNRDYHAHEACGTCQGIGNTVCTMCHGQRQEVCNLCHANGMIPCNFCHGSGQATGSDGKMRTCSRCNGTRQISCSTCQRTGHIMCRQCKGSGTSTCGSCKGAAFMTNICRTKINLETIFEFDRHNLPDTIISFFENTRTALTAPRHMDMNVQTVRRDDGGLAIEYQTKFPFGTIEFKIKDQIFKAHLFGKNAKLLKAPPFLKKIIRRPLDCLSKASGTQKNALTNLNKALQARYISDVVRLSHIMKPQKAMIGIKKLYPVGIDNRTIQQNVIQARKAVKNATRKARWAGYGITFAALLIMAIMYFVVLRPSITLSPTMTMLIDFSLIAVEFGVAYYFMKFYMRRILGQIFTDPNNPIIRKTPVSSLKITALTFAAWGLSIIFSAFIFGIAIHWLPF